MVTCVVCGKVCDDKNIKKSGKVFCSPEHLKKFESENLAVKPDNVCEFC